MAQKVNPIIFRLGTIQIWESLLQVYGKSFKQYSLILHKCLQLQNLLIRLFKKNNLLLDKQEWKLYQNKIFLSIEYLPLLDTKKAFTKSFFERLFCIINQWFTTKVIVQYYLKSELKYTTNLIVYYTEYLLEKNITSKKILLNLSNLLEKQLNFKKVSYFKPGILVVKLKGFKICLSGRLEGSKNQMAKSIEQTSGSLPLTSINNYVEYKTEGIHTKSGMFGIQIWLFYEII